MALISDSDIARFDAALTAANGDRPTAAAALGINPQQLHDTIQDNPQLHARWAGFKSRPTKRAAPTPEQVLSRDSKISDVPAPVLKREADLALAIAREDAKFKTGFSKFGFSPDELDLAVQLQSFHGQHFARCVDLITGGLTVTSVRVMLLTQRLAERLTTLPVINKLEGEAADKILDEQKLLWRQFHQCCDTLIRMSEAAANGNAIRAKIDLWKKQVQENQNRPKPGRPGFPVLIKTDNVTISEKP